MVEHVTGGPVRGFGNVQAGPSGKAASSGAPEESRKRESEGVSDAREKVTDTTRYKGNDKVAGRETMPGVEAKESSEDALDRIAVRCALDEEDLMKQIDALSEGDATKNMAKLMALNTKLQRLVELRQMCIKMQDMRHESKMSTFR